VPPGIGDAYWPLVKMRSTVKTLWGEDSADVLIVDDGSNKNRALEYVRRFPFVNRCGYLPKAANDTKWKPIWTDAYLRDGRTRFIGVDGCDLFLAYNGITRWGRSLEDVDQDATCEWFPPYHATVGELEAVQELRSQHGKWIVAYFVPWGMYREWLRELKPETIASAISECMAAAGASKALLPGASWDKGSPLAIALEKLLPGKLVNLSGQTTFDQASALIRGSCGVVGFPCGLSMMGVQLRKPTLLIWNKYFVERFWWNAVAPASWGSWYLPMDTAGFDPLRAADAFARLAHPDYSSKPTTEMSKQTRSLDMQMRMMSVLGDKAFKGQGAVHSRADANLRTPQTVIPAPPSPLDTKSFIVAAVLRSGGWCGQEDVVRLFRAVRRNVGRAKIECALFTDITSNRAGSMGEDRLVPLLHGWPGWWSKAELFRGDWRKGDERPVLYLDLDTAVTGDLTSVLVPAFSEVGKGAIVMLEDFGSERGIRVGCAASGVMVWSGNFTAPYEERVRIGISEAAPWWAEQEAIENCARASDKKVSFLQKITPANSVISYKWQAAVGGVPKEKLSEATKLVCFHGRPRPSEITGVQWLEEALS
jgi:hypothetical protein